MRSSLLIVSFAIAFSLLPAEVKSQVDDICREFGAMPTLEAPKLAAPFVYGKISIVGLASGMKAPKVTVTFSDAGLPAVRQTIDKSGNYCFKRTGGDGILVVDVNGKEFARKTIAGFGPPQQREDFEILSEPAQKPVLPGVVSAKFLYARNSKTNNLFSKAVEAEKNNDLKRAEEFMQELVTIDPLDFPAWAKLGSLFLGQGKITEAEAAFRRSLELKVEYTPAWIFMGQIRAQQKYFDSAIEIFKQAIETDPSSARAFQLLGETYLQAKKGTLGAEALNKAIELDPDGMAECHLLLAKLYDLAGAKELAVREYKTFLTKRPDHAGKARFEKYIKENQQ